MSKFSVLVCKNYSGAKRNVSFHVFVIEPQIKRKWEEAFRRVKTWISTIIALLSDTQQSSLITSDRVTVDKQDPAGNTGIKLRVDKKKRKTRANYIVFEPPRVRVEKIAMPIIIDAEFLEKCKNLGVGHRSYDNELFAKDPPPIRYGIYDEGDEDLCHQVITTTCHIPGCRFTTDSLLDFEDHYNATHRYTCSQCKKLLPSSHLLDLHIQENHDSFFAVMAERKPSYSCYIEECKEKFSNPEERLNHCVKIHRLPKDYRFDQLHGTQKSKKNKKQNVKESHGAMEIDSQSTSTKKFVFVNSKQKGFAKYTGKKFTHENKDTKETNVNIDQVMEELKQTLPG